MACHRRLFASEQNDHTLAHAKMNALGKIRRLIGEQPFDASGKSHVSLSAAPARRRPLGVAARQNNLVYDPSKRLGS
jgi:hypothetical protein